MTMAEKGSLIETRCPGCGMTVARERVYVLGREIFSGARVLCEACSYQKSRDDEAELAERRWNKTLIKHLPERYYKASEMEMREPFKSIYGWEHDEHSGGIGLIGPAGSGKSSALARLIRHLRTPFLWFSGPQARDLSTRMVSSDMDREGLHRQWERLVTIPILVIDDISKGVFTEAWGSRMFDLLEMRHQAFRPIFWTSQITIAGLRSKIQKQCQEGDVAEAISRRLCQHSLVINV